MIFHANVRTSLRRGTALLFAWGTALSFGYAPAQQTAIAPSIVPSLGGGRIGQSQSPQPSFESLDLNMYARIRDEGVRHGQAVHYAIALADGIGPRLTGSPNMKKANDWTRDTFANMGLKNAHLEDWGEFGTGWYQLKTWGRIVVPEPEPLWMEAAVWSTSTKGAVTGDVVYLPLLDASELESVKGTLKGKVLLLGAPRPLPEIDQPLSFRYTEDELRGIEGPGTPRRATGPPPANAPSRSEWRRVALLRQRATKMAQEEGALAILLPSHEEGRNVDTGLLLDDSGVELAWKSRRRENAVSIPYAVVMTEHYNRLARLAQEAVPIKVEVDIETASTGDHEHGFNTIAELPGTDKALANQIVMVGGHLDSWPAGTGATDDGAGAVIAMEAMRILTALDVKPRRTIRIALWSGEEEGEYGSSGYVHQHLLEEQTSSPTLGAKLESTARSSSRLTPTQEWKLFDAYYNIDEGGGRIRGIYTQGSYAAAAIFSQWIAPLKDLGVTAVTTRIDVGSDHESFDHAGLPGFEFLQDELDYETRTHHSNLDTVDHLQATDLEQAAIVEAIFLWNTSEREAMMPRKPYPYSESEQRLNKPIPVLFPGAAK